MLERGLQPWSVYESHKLKEAYIEEALGSLSACANASSPQLSQDVVVEEQVKTGQGQGFTSQLT